jgi:hypothetical protein
LRTSKLAVVRLAIRHITYEFMIITHDVFAQPLRLVLTQQITYFRSEGRSDGARREQKRKQSRTFELPFFHTPISTGAGRRIRLSELPQALQRRATLRLKAGLKRLGHARPLSLQAQAQASEIARSGNLAVIRIINDHSYTSYQPTTHITN